MKNIFLTLLFLTFIHCSKSENSQEVKAELVDIVDDKVDASIELKAPLSVKEEPSQNNVQDKAISTPQSTPQNQVIAKKIIKNGDIDIQVGDIRKAQAQVQDIIKKNNAYVQSENFNNSDNNDRLFLTIRVPHKNFDGLINSFSNGIGSVLSKNISSDDVTEEYTDVSIKLGNKKIYLEKYRDMLRGAKTTKDMLEIQENIRSLEDEIDVAEGRLRFIDDRVNYSTLNLTLFKEKVRSSTTSRIGFGSRFGDSVTEGWNGFVAFILGLISFWPFLLLIPIFIFIIKKWRSSNKNKQKTDLK